MGKLIVGILLVLPALASLSNLGGHSDPTEAAGALVGTLLLFGAAALLIILGAVQMKQKKTVVTLALPMLREQGKIDAAQLAQKAGVSEANARKYLTQAQRQGAIPADAGIE